jgi:hypothetical protein
MNMPRRFSRKHWAVMLLAVAVPAPVWVPYTCPLQRLFMPAAVRADLDLRNRTSEPAAADFDRAVTLQTLLAPGDDTARWSASRAAGIEGYVVAVEFGGLVELANCLSIFRRDIHVDIAPRMGGPLTERVVVEVTPPMREIARARGIDWSLDALQTLIGKRARIEGWLLFDAEHANQAEHLHPQKLSNWRATAWELHPVTAIHVLD